MNELVAVEGILGTSSVDANMAEPSTSQPKLKGKGKKKKKKKKDFTKQDGKQVALGVADKGKKIKGKCFIVVRKDFGKGIVQYLRLPRIKVWKIHSSLKYV